MRRKAGVRGDDIVVPDAKASPVHPVRILVVRKGEMMLGIQPAMIFPAKAFKWAQFDHLSSPPSQASLGPPLAMRSEEHTSELQSLMRISYAVFCLNKKRKNDQIKSKKNYNLDKNSHIR